MCIRLIFLICIVLSLHHFMIPLSQRRADAAGSSQHLSGHAASSRAPADDGTSPSSARVRPSLESELPHRHVRRSHMDLQQHMVNFLRIFSLKVIIMETISRIDEFFLLVGKENVCICAINKQWRLCCFKSFNIMQSSTKIIFVNQIMLKLF